MYKNFTICLVFTLLLAFSYSGCSRQLADNQIQFGVQAAPYEKKGLWDEAKKEYEIASKISPENKYIKSNYENFIKNYESFKKEKKDGKS